MTTIGALRHYSTGKAKITCRVIRALPHNMPRDKRVMARASAPSRESNAVDSAHLGDVSMLGEFPVLETKE